MFISWHIIPFSHNRPARPGDPLLGIIITTHRGGHSGSQGYNGLARAPQRVNGRGGPKAHLTHCPPPLGSGSSHHAMALEPQRGKAGVGEVKQSSAGARSPGSGFRLPVFKPHCHTSCEPGPAVWPVCASPSPSVKWPHDTSHLTVAVSSRRENPGLDRGTQEGQRAG